MIFAIHKQTKEHRVVSSLDAYSNHDWRYVEADAGGWIKWDRKDAPLPPGRPHEVLTEEGFVFPREATEHTNWTSHSSVDFYRPIPSKTSETEVTAWDGEDLPSVGCECDCYHTGTYQGVVTVRYMGSEMCVLLNHDHGEEQCGPIDAYSFRPIRSEEEDAKHEMARVITSALGTASPEWWDASKAIFQAIRDGEIPGVALTGGES